MTPPDLTHSPLSDAALLDEATRLAAEGRRATSDLVAVLVALDARRLYLAHGYQSLFDFCQRRLRLSESEAYHRIEAARTARLFPVVLERLRAGALTLTTVALLRPHLTEANHAAVLAWAEGRTKREVEVFVRALDPRPDVPTSIRRLADPGPRNASGMSAAARASAALGAQAVGWEARRPSAVERIEPVDREATGARGVETVEAGLAEGTGTGVTGPLHARAGETTGAGAAATSRAFAWEAAQAETAAIGETNGPHAAATSRAFAWEAAQAETIARAGVGAAATAASCDAPAIGRKADAASDALFGAPATTFGTSGAGLAQAAGGVRYPPRAEQAEARAVLPRVAVAGPAPGRAVRGRPAAIRPLSPARYSLQVTISEETRAKLRRAQALLWHAEPHADEALVLDRALTLLVETLERRKFAALKLGPPRGKPGPGQAGTRGARAAGRRAEVCAARGGETATPTVASAPTVTAAPAVTTTPTKIATPTVASAPTVTAAPAVTAVPSVNAPPNVTVTPAATAMPAVPARTRAPAGRRSRTIPAAVRREVWIRDEGSCAYVGSAGRCGQTTGLEYHHRVPVADGGASTAANLSLRCLRHHAVESARWFGEDQVVRPPGVGAAPARELPEDASAPARALAHSGPSHSNSLRRELDTHGPKCSP